MSSPKAQRRLAAILAADVVGYSGLMGEDEEGTLARIKDLRREVIEPRVKDHEGRVFKTTGDGFLAEFSSPVEAVRCALDIQDALRSPIAQDTVKRLQLRIGVNLGDIIIDEDGDIYGDGVNVAVRLEQLAEPGGISISGAVYDQIDGKVDQSFERPGHSAGQEHRQAYSSVCAFEVGYCEHSWTIAFIPSGARQALHRCPAIHEHER